LLVTSGSLFWIVAVGPEKTAIFGFDEVGCCAMFSSCCPEGQTFGGRCR
jgi:hypothetical protein